ncbi:hypothetical protein CJ030_MR4G010999 [Morella rubra]|uniref:Uncharacterized protein n=1 Tax=Morella rubra TaxID=262757 RepID=A0A6A1VUZ7_9ROSI|nr:hypothetical protein CJ030_MR4G010999 [Morella rubra]
MAPRSTFEVSKDSPLFQARSRCKEDTLAKSRRLYFVPDSIRMCAPDKNEYVLFPRESEFAFFLDVLVDGFRFPFLEEVKKVLNFLLLALSQLSSNSWRFLLGFIFLWRERFLEGPALSPRNSYISFYHRNLRVTMGYGSFLIKSPWLRRLGSTHFASPKSPFSGTPGQPSAVSAPRLEQKIYKRFPHSLSDKALKLLPASPRRRVEAQILLLVLRGTQVSPFHGFKKGATYIGTAPTGLTPFNPQGEGVSDLLATLFLDPIARLQEFIPTKVLPTPPPHLESIIPTATHQLLKTVVTLHQAYDAFRKKENLLAEFRSSLKGK